MAFWACVLYWVLLFVDSHFSIKHLNMFSGLEANYKYILFCMSQLLGEKCSCQFFCCLPLLLLFGLLQAVRFYFYSFVCKMGLLQLWDWICRGRTNLFEWLVFSWWIWPIVPCGHNLGLHFKLMNCMEGSWQVRKPECYA